MTIAVLFARADSFYKTLPGCDVYDIDRDARTWGGGCPVVAHPPCRAWGQLSFFAKPRENERELAPWSIAQIRRYGGVLEHPAASKLWPTLGLPEPGAGKDEFGGWTLGIHQHCFGHKAEKKTKLYIVGCEPWEIPDMPMKMEEPTHVIGDCGRAGYICPCGHRFGPKLGKYGCPNCCGDSGPAKPTKKPEVSKAEREHTPHELAVWLVELARRCKVKETVQ